MKALVVDGYNVINKIPRLRALMDKSLESARKEITALAREYQRKIGGIRKLVVVFDGQDRYRCLPDRPGREQIFSRTGEGDLEIIRTVRRFSEDHSVVVVSDDNFIRNNARAYNASIVTVEDFSGSVRGHRRVMRETGPQRPDKVSPAQAARINEELRKIWKLDR